MGLSLLKMRPKPLSLRVTIELTPRISELGDFGCHVGNREQRTKHEQTNQTYPHAPRHPAPARLQAALRAGHSTHLLQHAAGAQGHDARGRSLPTGVMKIFLISQQFNTGYDTYDSAVVIAPDAEAAKLMHPRSGGTLDSDDWVSDSNLVSAREIGEAKEPCAQSVVCSSFNAG